MVKNRKQEPADGNNPESAKGEDRQARRAASLRENLRKRKAQQRGRAEKPDGN